MGQKGFVPHRGEGKEPTTNDRFIRIEDFEASDFLLFMKKSTHLNDSFPPAINIRNRTILFVIQIQ